jgi:hypothetical protein
VVSFSPRVKTPYAPRINIWLKDVTSPLQKIRYLSEISRKDKHRPYNCFVFYYNWCPQIGPKNCTSMTDGQSASLSVNKAPIWGVRPDIYYCQTVAGWLIWGALSEAIAAGPRQRSHSRVRLPWDSRQNFTVSVSRLPFSSPPTTRRATVEVFNPASTWD